MLPLVLSGFQTHHLTEDGSSVMKKNSDCTMLTTWLEGRLRTGKNRCSELKIFNPGISLSIYCEGSGLGEAS